MLASSFRFAWSARPSVHWIAPILAGIPFGWGNVCLFVSGLPSSTPKQSYMPSSDHNIPY